MVCLYFNLCAIPFHICHFLQVSASFRLGEGLYMPTLTAESSWDFEM